eukprot:GILK01005283.1.p1 GENE.GILK01005283.1~~GILK01005283.1.p1  ORF type:complete len:1742 (+),score=283.35 GILK01005283.1:94-5319(+)
MSSFRVPSEILTREQRARRYGVDCGNDLLWKDWVPGGEIVKKLIIKNVSKKTQNLKYTLPVTKYFSMEYPEPIKLHPGMSKTVSISFRPIRLEPYADYIEFTTDHGRFYVPVKAIVPQVAIRVTESIDFGFCPVHEVSKQKIFVYNTGQLPAPFEWSLNLPFSISPASGVVEANETMECELTFAPKDATVLVASAVCSVQGVEPQIMKLSGIGKYPFLAAMDDRIHFESTLVGKVAERELILRNMSLVDATFKVTAEERETDPVFVFRPTAGVIPPDGTLALSVTYTPTAVGAFNSSNFAIRTPGGNVVKVTCIGQAIGHSVTLSSKSINFGDVSSGNQLSRLITITNHSDLPTSYQFQIDNESAVFAIEKKAAVLAPRHTTNITVFFKPLEPINYHQRVWCIVKGQSPLYVDLVGTAYDSKRRPAPLAQKHIDLHRFRVIHGQTDLEVADPNDPSTDSAEFPDVDPEEPSIVSLHKELFWEMSSRTREISVEEEEIDFGSCSALRLVEKKTVTVLNRSKHKVTCTWMVEPDTKSSSSNTPPIFSIFPVSQDIKPNSSVEFKVSFRPPHSNFYFQSELEAYVYVKSNRTFRLVRDHQFVPPWCIKTRLHGHTFQPQAEHFLPRVSFSSSNLVFPSCLPQQCVYQTVQISSASDTPTHFKFMNDLTGAFRITPSSGLIQPNSFQLLCVEFAPKAAKRYFSDIQCLLNYSASNTHTLHLHGVCDVPALTVGDDGHLFLPPACVGAVTSREVTIRNTSKVPLQFQWNIPEKHKRLISVKPVSGRLESNDTAAVKWSFTPLNQKSAQYSIQCLAAAILDLEQKVCGVFLPGSGASVREVDASQSSTKIVLHTEGTVGSMSIQPEVLDLGSVLVGNTCRKAFSIHNSGHCSLPYGIQILHDQTDEPLNEEEQQWLSVDNVQGTVPARAHKRVVLSFSPTRRVSYRLKIRVSPHIASDSKSPSQRPSIEASAVEMPVLAHADYPQIRISDIRLDGEGQSISWLWSQLSATQINDELAGELRDPERRYISAVGLDETARLQEMLQHFICDFGNVIDNGPDKRLLVRITNSGNIPAPWNFRLPTDRLVDMEQWADEGEPTPAMASCLNILTNDIMAIEPRRGSLAPGESQVVVFTYRPIQIDSHSMDVVFQIQRGKSIVLRLTGSTLPASSCCLCVRSNTFELSPVAIGDTLPPVQITEIRNEGGAPLRFEVDLNPLDLLNMMNYNFPVLKCLRSEGVLEPGESGFVSWVFTPLESKTYETVVPIFVYDMDSDTAVQRLDLKVQGQGYHPLEDAEPDQCRLMPVLPLHQSIRAGSCSACLSIEEIQFGSVPLRSMNDRLVVLENRSETHAMEFQWDIRGLLPEHELTVTPASGRIEPGQHLSLKVCLSIQETPLVLQGEIECRVKWLNDNEDANSYSLHMAALKSHESYENNNLALSSRRVPESSVNYDDDRVTVIDEPRQLTRRELARVGQDRVHIPVAENYTQSRLTAIAASQGTRKMNQTMPTGFKYGTTNTAASAASMSVDPMRVSQRLNSTRGKMVVSALKQHTHPVFNDEPTSTKLYLRLFGKVYLSSEHNPAPPQFYLPDRADPVAVHAAVDSDVLHKAQLQLQEEQLAVSEDLITQLLREIIADPNVQSTLDVVQKDPTPFFIQLSSSRPPTPYLTPAATPRTMSRHGSHSVLPNQKAFSGIPENEEVVEGKMTKKKLTGETRVLVSSEFSEVAQNLLTDALFSLVQEAIDGQLYLDNESH